MTLKRRLNAFALALLASTCVLSFTAGAASADPKRAPDDEEPRSTAPAANEPPKTDIQPAPTGEKKDERPNAEGNSETLAIGAPHPIDEASPTDGKLQVHPYFLVSGGVKADLVDNKEGEDKNDRVSTFALGRIGLRASWLSVLYAESEFMASGGVGLHGTSAYEGQAALQVRQQLIRLSKWGFRLEVGRLIDEASVDFFSAHVAESFIQDTATRDALLFTGFNLGNGVRTTYELVPGLRLGLTFNAANPVASTASLMVGGAYPPFERFYTQPYQQVNQSANHFPDDTFHSMILTPSVLFDSKYFDAKVAAQLFDINVNTTRSDDDHIRGYNLRGTLRAKIADGLLIPFVSTAYTRNDTLNPADLSKRSPDRYQAVNVGGGVDLDLQRRFRCSHDCADGIGVQYQQVQYQIGENGLVSTQRFVNVGGTYWLMPNVSLGVRFAWWTLEAERALNAAEAAAGVKESPVDASGEKSVIAALRFIMP